MCEEKTDERATEKGWTTEQLSIREKTWKELQKAGKDWISRFNASALVSNTKEVPFDEQQDLYLVAGVCPVCRGIFGVDITFLEQIDTVVACPICLNQVEFPD